MPEKPNDSQKGKKPNPFARGEELLKGKVIVSEGGVPLFWEPHPDAITFDEYWESLFPGIDPGDRRQ